MVHQHLRRVALSAIKTALFLVQEEDLSIKASLASGFNRGLHLERQ